ncbi:MAG: hypothetical protein U0984_00735 [Prosthecobacter sp.]|nr:hypothetical protein [Prosthecobacter sp.]
MLQVSQLQIPIDHTDADLRQAVLNRVGVKAEELRSLKIKQRAIDARRGHVAFIYTLLIEVADEARVLKGVDAKAHVIPAPDETYREFTGQPAHHPACRPVVVGSGPCGLFCGLLLARAGWKPIILERGKAAGDRARDVTGFWRRGWDFNPESNVQFGEGGAGTFSDGKLYTQIRDREHRIPWLLRELVAAGAPEDILIKARPHIGTDRLIKVVRHIREEIIALGGEVRFNARVSEARIESGVMRAVTLADGSTIEGDHFIFAIGHSSRDTFQLLHAGGVPLEPKPFSIGVRIEHPQRLVDKMLYGKWAGHDRLGSAPYKFVAHCGNGRSAYSFCMCPGGLVVAATSEAGMVVTNGMSSYARADANANSGFMVEINAGDYGDAPLAGIEFQREIERSAFRLGGGNYHAPAQLLGDLMAGRASTGQGSVVPSYEPGVVWSDLRECLPEYVIATLKESVPRICKSLPGFMLEDAVLTAAETRSSSPSRIPRDPASFECIGIKHFYPAGEGAGYAGGIISAAADGMRVAEALLRSGG